MKEPHNSNSSIDQNALPETGVLRLHIGGHQIKEGWKILNIQAKAGVDFIGNASDLSQFKDNSVDEIYASHVYEHLDYDKELARALAEAYRVLKPGGILRAGVPDLEALSWLILNPKLNTEKKFHVMRIMFGGHTDEFDYHYVGLTEQIFALFLTQAGFKQIQRLKTFGIFNDTTNLIFENVVISLNMMAIKTDTNICG